MRNEMEMLVLSTCRLYNYEFDGSFSYVVVVAANFDEKYKSINRCIKMYYLSVQKTTASKETLKQLSFAWKEAIAIFKRGGKKKIVFNFFIFHGLTTK